MNSSQKTTTKKFKKNTPHDVLISKGMEDPDIAGEFLAKYLLPEESKEFINLSTLQIEEQSYVKDSLQKKLSDIVYSAVTTDNKQIFIHCLLKYQPAGLSIEAIVKSSRLTKEQIKEVEMNIKASSSHQAKLRKTAIDMLKQKADTKFIAAFTGLSTDEILKLKNKL
jgi:hypothetical protein